MIERYQSEKMRHLWSEQVRFEAYLKVELANAYAWMKDGLFKEEDFQLLEKASFDIARIKEIEMETRHDIVAFVKAVSETLGEEKKWLHYGLTSTDVVDTAYAIILKEVNEIILKNIISFMDVLKEKAYQYQYTPLMGRTHGMHAEITSLGMKFALWYEDFKRLKEKFILASKEIEVIKLSGAVGTYSTSHPGIQNTAAKYLGLSESFITTQTLQRDRHAFYLSIIALIGSELEKIATEIRHLSRTEVKEVGEAFGKGQKGSSAMPHKKNPIASENISGLSRVLRGYMHTAYENIALWHERDISHSSTERIILPDSTSLISYMLERYQGTLNNLAVNEDNMLENIGKSRGLYATQKVMNHLVNKGFDRLSMHDELQKMSRTVESQRKHLKEVIIDNKAISELFSNEDLDSIFSLQEPLKHTKHIFDRVFENGKG